MARSCLSCHRPKQVFENVCSECTDKFQIAAETCLQLRTEVDGFKKLYSEREKEIFQLMARVKELEANLGKVMEETAKRQKTRREV